MTRGKGPTYRRAWLGATGEMYQSLAVTWRDTDEARVRRAAERTLESEGAEIISPGALNPFSTAQTEGRERIGYDRTGYPVSAPPPYGERERSLQIGWLRGRDVESDATVWVPANAVLVGGPPDTAGGETFHRGRLHNGIASAGTRAMALAKAILERVEHDALSWWWLLERRCPRIALEGWREPWLEKIEPVFARAGRTVIALDITTTTQAPTALAATWLTEPLESGSVELLIASASGLGRREALVGAIGEVIQKLPEQSGGEALSQLVGEGEDLEWWRTIDPEHSVRFAGNGETIQAEHGQSDALEPMERLARAITAARDAGAARVVGVDLTRPEQPVTTVRALTPGLRDSYAQRAPGRYDRHWPWLRDDEHPKPEHALSRDISVL